MVGSTYFAVMAGGLGSNKLLVRQLEKAPALRDAFFVCGVPTEILSTSVTRFTFMFSDFIDGCVLCERRARSRPRDRRWQPLFPAARRIRAGAICFKK
mmetsp:Transcript_15743/g.37383  ORF Transcript_15743/g.37383 Transcript_15743/m.37383 type:complete len:98 (-) Transcript_15743:110-403(-)